MADAPVGKPVGLDLKSMLASSQEKRQASKAAVVSKSASGKKYHLYSKRPDLGFFVNSKDRIKFKGNYYDTDSEDEVKFALAHYGKLVSDISEDMRVESEQNKVDQKPLTPAKADTK